MSPWITALIVIGLLVSVLFVRGIDASTKRKLNQLFTGRRAQTEDEFYDRFFPDSGVPRNVVTKIREIFQEHIPFEPTLLEADDDLSGDFKMIWDLDSMADVEIVIALEEQFDIKVTDEEAAAMKTIRKVVEVVWSKING